MKIRFKFGYEFQINDGPLQSMYVNEPDGVEISDPLQAKEWAMLFNRLKSAHERIFRSFLTSAVRHSRRPELGPEDDTDDVTAQMISHVKARVGL